MSEEKFDAIIVGGGLAGATAAYILANAGMEVLLADRGDFCGSKNVTGGRLYAHSLEKVFPGFAEEAPIERKVTHEKISLMTPKSSLDIGFSSEKLGEDPESASYTILHSKFDPWLAEKCEEAGVMLVPGIRVDSCVVEDGKVVGIDAGGEIMYSDVVIIADGVNSLLAQKLGMKKELTPHEVAVGVKEVIKLDEEVINQRFGVRGNEGVAWLSAGDATAGAFGGGLLYTNKDTISIEVCHPDDSGQFNPATYAAVVRLTAWLCETGDLSTAQVIRHYDVSGKECPRYYVRNEAAWQQFLTDVQSQLDT
jgi:electron transfer flavoprotein-quinone oxidoreductase